MAIMQYEDAYDQSIDASDAHVNMNIFSADGEHIGVVNEVWAHVPGYGYIAKSRFQLDDYGPVKGNGHLFAGTNGYVHVVPSGTFRRESDQEMFIPVSLVRRGGSNTELVTAHRMEDCRAMFAGVPDQL